MDQGGPERDAEEVGDLDQGTVDSIYQVQYKGVPNLKMARVDDSRHFVMYDRPAKLDAAVEGFLR